MAQDLDAEFEPLHVLYQADPALHIDKFALLFIETLQSDPSKTSWSELSEKFPACVRVWAMDHKKYKFKKLLDIDSKVFDRWHAELALQIQDTKLSEIKSEPLLRKQQKKVASCLDKCSNLMLQLIDAEHPETIVALSQVMNSAYSPTLQLRILETRRRALLKLVPALKTKNDVHIFKECIREGELHQKMMKTPSEESRAAHSEHIKTLAFKLHDEVVSNKGISDTILDKYSLAVQQHAMGSLQAVLMARLQSPQRLDELRKKMSEINEEFDPYYNRKILLLRNLRLKLKLSRKTGRSIADMIKRVIQTLPVKIILTVIKEAEYSLPEMIDEGGAIPPLADSPPLDMMLIDGGAIPPLADSPTIPPLDMMLIDALRKMPRMAVMRPLKRYGVKMVAATPDRLKAMVRSVIMMDRLNLYGLDILEKTPKMLKDTVISSIQAIRDEKNAWDMRNKAWGKRG